MYVHIKHDTKIRKWVQCSSIISRMVEKMKHIIYLIIIFLYIFSTSHSYAQEKSKLISNEEKITKIYFQSLSPLITEHEKYDYSTTGNEIKYITHYFNCLYPNESLIATPSDSKSFLMIFYYEDGTEKLFYIYPPTGILANPDVMYNVSKQNLHRFLSFIESLKIKQTEITNNATYEISEWAKPEVTKAIESDLVPKWNQIGYQEKITRLEVCQLIANFLEKEGITEQAKILPFTDTIDPSVVMLHQLNIINGKTETLFYPYDLITREEFAKILSNTYQLIHNDLSLKEKIIYIDDADISAWAKLPIYSLTQIGIFKGNDNNEFLPKNNITKEQVIATLLRLSKKED